MRKTLGTLLIALGILLVLTAAVMTGNHFRSQQKAGEEAQAALEALEIPEPVVETTPDIPDIPGKPAQIPHYQLNPEMGMPEKEVDGIAYIGTLEIPVLELCLPVISATTGAHLQIAPCRFTGSAYLDDLVVGAHNYAAHFGRLSSLSYGDVVKLTDMDGNRFVYQVADIEILQPDQKEELCSGEWPLSLYTCTPGGRTRLTVRCEKIR